MKGSLPIATLSTVAAQIQIEQRLDAPREVVWRAVSEAAGIARWQADAVIGSLDEGRFVLGWPSIGARLDLEVESAEPEQRLRLRNGDSSLTLTLLDRGIRLEHEGLAPTDDIAGMRASWTVALAILRHYLRYHEGTDRVVSWAIAELPTTPEIAHVYFSEAAALRSWLIRSGGGIGEVGSSVSFTTQWGANVEGYVLAHQPGRDVAISWLQNDNSALVLRTLPSPMTNDSRMVAVTHSHWGRREGPNRALERRLHESLGRLGWSLGTTMAGA